MKRKTFIEVLGLLACLIAIVGSVAPVAWAAPTVLTNKSSYLRGETVTVSVTGGTANDIVMIQFENPVGTKVWVDQGSFGSGGAFQYQLKIPSGWAYGGYTVRVKDMETDSVGTVTFQVAAPPTPPPSPPPPSPPPPSPPVNKLPVADAGPDQTAFVNRNLHFDGSGSYDPDGTVVSHVWTFGDGVTASGVRVSHVYTSPGSYTVTLTVTDNLQAKGSDTCVVTSTVLPVPPVAGVEEGVAADEKDHVVNALEEAYTTVTVNTTAPVTVMVLRYPENPYPDAPLPEKLIPVFVDIFVSSPDSVIWPIYVERHYTDEEAAGLDETKLAIYYYKEGAWHRCRETGAYPERNVIWARMYEDEVTGSVTVIGEVPAAAAFELSDLSVTPPEVDVGEPVTVSVKVTNVGEESGNYTVTLKVAGLIVDTERVTFDGGESATVSFTIVRDVAGTYSVQVDGLTGSFTVKATPAPAEFKVSNLQVAPAEVNPGEAVTVSVLVSNVGKESGSYTVRVRKNGAILGSESVTLMGGASAFVILTVSSYVVGSHAFTVDGLSGSYRVVASPPPEPFPWHWIVLAVAVVSIFLYLIWSRTRKRAPYKIWEGNGNVNS